MKTFIRLGKCGDNTVGKTWQRAQEQVRKYERNVCVCVLKHLQMIQEDLNYL